MLLQLYLITEILAPFFASLAVLTGVLFLGRLVPMLDTIIGFGIGMPDFVRICAYLTPKLLLFAIPMASMMGVIIAFTRLSSDNELMALNSAGIGIGRLLPSVVVVALCTTLLTGFASASLSPQGTIAMKKLFFELAREKISKGIEPRQFSEGIRNVVFFVDGIDRDSGNWHGIYVSDFRHKENPVTIMAQEGKIATDSDAMNFSVTLRNGSMHRAVNELSQTIQFREYRLTLPVEFPDGVEDPGARKSDRNTLGIKELRQQAAKSGSESGTGRTLMIEFHKRLALPVGCLVLSLLGLPLTLQSRPGSRSLGITLGLLFFVSYYVMITAAKAFAEKEGVPVAPVMWAPNILLALLAAHLLNKERKTGGLGLERRSLGRRLSALAGFLAAKITRGGKH